MKIIYYSTAYYAKHGGSNHSKAFIRECEKHPLVSEVLVFPNHQKEAIFVAQNVVGWKDRIKKNAFIQLLNFFRRNNFYYPELVKVIKEKQPDIVHVRLDSNFLQIGRLKKEFPNIKITTEVNASPFDESFNNILFKSFFNKLEKRLLSKSDLNFFVSSFLREKLIGKSMDQERDQVVHNGVDLKVFKKKETQNKDLPILKIGYIGTLDVHKKVDVLIQSVRELNKRGLIFQLILVGDGPARIELENLVKNLALENISFLGWKSHEEIPAILSQFDIAIHHYAKDYMSPLKIFEYMAAKVPCIGPDTSAVREVFKDREQLILTDGEVDDLVVKIEELILDEALRQRLAQAAYNLVSSSYTWQANVDFIITKMAELNN